MGIGAGVVAGVGAISKTIAGAKQVSRARKAIENYQRQELTNAYEGQSVSTLGADFQAEQMAQATATGVRALQKAGARALMGGVGRLQAGVTDQSRQIAADLDRQQRQIDRMYAQDQTRIRALQERREEADLAGLGQELAVGQQNLFGGLGDISQGMFAMGGLMGGGSGLGTGATSAATAPGMFGSMGSGLQASAETPRI